MLDFPFDTFGPELSFDGTDKAYTIKARNVTNLSDEVNDMIDWLDNRGGVEKAINGAVIDAINQHGPITRANISSTSKRVYNALKELRRREKEANAKGGE